MPTDDFPEAPTIGPPALLPEHDDMADALAYAVSALVKPVSPVTVIDADTPSLPPWGDRVFMGVDLAQGSDHTALTMVELPKGTVRSWTFTPETLGLAGISQLRVPSPVVDDFAAATNDPAAYERVREALRPKLEITMHLEPDAAGLPFLNTMRALTSGRAPHLARALLGASLPDIVRGVADGLNPSFRFPRLRPPRREARRRHKKALKRR